MWPNFVSFNQVAIILMAVAVLTAASSCSRKSDTAIDAINNPSMATLREEFQIPYQPAYGQGVRGYNEPFPESHRSGIGLRAVTWDRWLAISVRNLGEESLLLEPEAFRLLMPDRSLYAIGQERHRMGLFLPAEVPAGENHVFIARLPELDNLQNLNVILNYPPRQAILRSPIEPTPEPTAPDEPRSRN